MKSNKKYFYGIYGIEFVWRGEWSDPELIWHEKSFNYFDLEDPLYNDFCEDMDEIGINPEADGLFETWVKDHAYLAREYLQNLMDVKCFYGCK